MVTMNGRVVPGGVITGEMLAQAGGMNGESLELECRWGTNLKSGTNAKTPPAGIAGSARMQ